MKKVLFCSITVLLMMCVLCLPLFSAAGDTNTAAVSSSSSYLLGDVDGNGSVEIMDATTIQRVLAHMLTDDDGMYTKRGDIDGDGSLTTVDVTWIQRYLAHMDVPFPINEPIAEPTEEPTEAIVEPTAAPTVAPTQRPTTKPDPYELPPI